jgi:hypothetical protein
MTEQYSLGLLGLGLRAGPESKQYIHSGMTEEKLPDDIIMDLLTHSPPDWSRRHYLHMACSMQSEVTGLVCGKNHICLKI